MNILFGVSLFPGFRERVQSVADDTLHTYHQQLRMFENPDSSSLIGHISDGVILGHASDAGKTVHMIGTLHGPLPGWSGSSPVGAADLSAQYLLSRYLERGHGFLEGVTGQFGVVVSDKDTCRLLLGCDSTGQRNIFFSEFDGGFAFSSNLRLLSKLCWPRVEVDRSIEDFLLMYGFCPNDRTLFAGIRALGSKIIEWSGGSLTEHKVNTVDDWSSRLPSLETASNSEQNAIDLLYDAFMHATEDQLSGQKKVAVLLGGFDSALVASALHRLGKEVETYSFDYAAHAEFNQPLVSEVTKALGGQHHWVPINKELIGDGLRRFAETFNYPTNWPNYVMQTAHLAQRIRDDGILHCYSGDGCDAVFMGYPGTYRRSVLFGSVPRFPEVITHVLIGLFASRFLDRKLGHPYRVFLNILRSSSRELPARAFGSFRIMDEVSLDALARYPLPSSPVDVDNIITELAEPYRGHTPARLGFYGKSLVSPNRNKIVGSVDHAGITILSPYMHPEFKSLALRLPDKLCRPEEPTASAVTGKYILMRMAETKGLLPPNVIYQPKVAAVDAPVDAWYSGSLKPIVLEILQDLPFDWNPDYIEDLIAPHFAESMFKKYIMTDKIIKHAVSILLTYAAFSKLSDSADVSATGVNV